MKPSHIRPKPGQMSVWDFPSPPYVETTRQYIVVIFNERVIVETRRPRRLLQTGHPPVYFIPPEDIKMNFLKPTDLQALDEAIGKQHFLDLEIKDRLAEKAAMTFPTPLPGYEILRDCISFHAGHMDVCYVDDRKADPEPDEDRFGWITPSIVGPFVTGSETGK